jgi:hypothetical protein
MYLIECLIIAELGGISEWGFTRIAGLTIPEPNYFYLYHFTSRVLSQPGSIPGGIFGMGIFLRLKEYEG